MSRVLDEDVAHLVRGLERTVQSETLRQGEV